VAKAVVLLSGGLDSATVLGSLIANGTDPGDITTISFDYGQKHKMREVMAAYMINNYYHVESHRKISIDTKVFQGAKSTLVGEMLPNPHMTYKEIEESFGVSPTYVPFRNAIFLSIASAVALTVDAEYVYSGIHAEDARNWAYPDCTPEFVGSMGSAIYIGTYHKVRLITPFSWWMKWEIVKLGLEIGVPYHLTWTCYEGSSLSMPACGRCPSCVERRHAFSINGAEDPIKYKENLR